MKIVVFLMCVFGSSLAAPALDSGSNEVTAHNANTALHLMELYRIIGQLKQQAAPAVPAPADALSQVLPQAPQQAFNPALFAPQAVGSDEEDTPFHGFYVPRGSQPAQPAAPLNSDEAEAAEEAEAVEVAEGAEPTEAAPAVEVATSHDVVPVAEDVAVDVAVDVTVVTGDPAPDATASALVDIELSAVPQEPVVAIETDTNVVVPDGAEHVVVAEALETVLPVQ